MAQTSDDISIRPFQFHASDEALEDLRRRIAATKWPGRELVTDASQGVQLATMQKLARYWQTDYDWRTVDLVMSGKGGATITELAATVGVSPSYFTRVFRLSFLAPEITRTILQGRQPLGLTANTLIRGGKLPSAWSDQHPAAEPRLIRTVLRLRRKQPAC